MTFDYVAQLATQPPPAQACTTSSKALQVAVACYMQPNYKDSQRSKWIKKGIQFEPDRNNHTPAILPSRNSVLIEIHFTLTSPWYSKSTEKFAPIDNMCCKDNLTGQPMIWATSWKGNFRTMLEQDWLEMVDGPDKKNLMTRINELFGPDKEEVKNNAREGRLVFFPTCFDRLEGEVITPHDREKGIVTSGPIYYEVVPAGRTGRMNILYFPFDLVGKNKQYDIIIDDLTFILKNVRVLLEEYGFSAKKTLSWGLAMVDSLYVQSSFYSPAVTYTTRQKPAASVNTSTSGPMPLPEGVEGEATRSALAANGEWFEALAACPSNGQAIAALNTAGVSVKISGKEAGLLRAACTQNSEYRQKYTSWKTLTRGVAEDPQVEKCESYDVAMIKAIKALKEGFPCQS